MVQQYFYSDEEIFEFQSFIESHMTNIPKEWNDDKRKKYKRWRQRRNEIRYANKHPERRLESGRKYEKTRKGINRYQQNPEVGKKATKKYLDKKRQTDPQFYENEEIRMAEYRTTEKYQQHLVDRKIKTNYVIRCLRSRANHVGLEVTLTDEEIAEICVMPCNYCDLLDSTHLNGIDRVDSFQDYHFWNVVPCCAMCNFMKRDMKKEDFINICKHISGVESHSHLFETASTTSFNNYIYGAQNRDLEFNLNETEFNELVTSDCFYCKHTNCSGIDRIDSNEGYFLENVVPCCKTCNYLKRDFDQDKFFEKCNKIAMKYK